MDIDSKVCWQSPPGLDTCASECIVDKEVLISIFFINGIF
jgi:hypothetical protein